MAAGDPPIFETALQGWRYAFAALSRMPGILGIGMLATFALNVAWLPLMPSDLKEETTLVLQLAGLLVGIVQGFLLTPVAIAVHRFVLLGEITPRYALTPSEPRFMRFFIFSALYQLLVGVPGSLMSLTGKADSGLGSVSAILFSILFIIALIASIRMLILFPAIAVDARGADWRNAMADTKGHSWRVFFIMIATALPMLALVLPLYFMLGGTEGPGFAGGLVLSAVQAVVGVFALAAYAAVASRLFAAFANRLNG